MGRRYRLPSRLVQRIRRELGNIYDTIAVDVSQPSFHCRFSSSKPTQLPPLAIHALRLCLGAYRTFPSSSLCVEANEPPLYFRHKKLSLQYCLKLSCNYNNPTLPFSILNFTLYLKENLLSYLPLQSVFHVICKQLVSKRVMLLHLLYQPHRHGF